MKNNIIYITIFIIGILLGFIITRLYYKDFILKTDFHHNIFMVSIGKRAPEFLFTKQEYKRTKTMFEEKAKLERLELEADWLILGDYLQRETIFPTSIDTIKSIEK